MKIALAHPGLARAAYGTTVASLLVGTQRIEVNPELDRRANRFDAIVAALAVGAAAAGL